MRLKPGVYSGIWVCSGIARVLLGYCSGIARVLLGYYLGIAWVCSGMPGYYFGIALVSLGNARVFGYARVCSGIARVLLGYFLGMLGYAWVLLGYQSHIFLLEITRCPVDQNQWILDQSFIFNNSLNEKKITKEQLSGLSSMFCFTDSFKIWN